MQNEPQAGTDDLIASLAAADLLGVSISTIQRMAARGDLPYITKMPGLRGPYLFRRVDVEALKVSA